MQTQFESIDNLEIQKTRLEDEIQWLQDQKVKIVSEINETSEVLKDMEQSAIKLKKDIQDLTKQQITELEKRKQLFWESASIIKDRLNTEFANYVLSLPLFQTLLEQIISFNQSHWESYEKTFQLFNLLKEKIEAYENKHFIVQDFVYDYEKIVRHLQWDIALTKTLRNKAEESVKYIEAYVKDKQIQLDRREYELWQKNSLLKERELKIQQDKEAMKSEWFAIIQAKKEVDKLKAELKD